ncbi:MAG: sodium:solute symporter family protein [Fibrobacterota bacterium]
MAFLDWSVVAVYLVISVAIGLYFTRRARASKDDYLLAGRSLGWFIAGTSIVATTFSSDTPLFVARISRETGIFENWWWWSAAIGGLASVFFFARLWRRIAVTTDVEFINIRYDDTRSKDALRVFRAFFDGVFMNCTIVASVTLGMVKITTTVLGLSGVAPVALPLLGPVSWPVLILLVLSLFTLLYTMMSGLYGVVYTDVFQFMLAIFGCIVLAILVYVDASKGPGFIANISAAPGFKPQLLSFFPSFKTFDLLTFTFFVYMGIFWWNAVPSGSYVVQRILSTKNETEAAKAFLWFNVAHFVIRPWPWVIVGLVSLIYFPNLTGPAAETAFPAMVALFMPIGLKGLMVSALMAAYMSTVSTHLHLGVSYLVNDIYQPYLVKGRSQKHYVKAAQLGMLLLMLVAGSICVRLKGIEEVYRFLGIYAAGLGTVMIARWFWWRVNAKAEIAAMLGSAGLTVFLNSTLAERWLTAVCLRMGLITPETVDPDFFAVRVVIAMTLVLALWIGVVLVSGAKTPSEKVVGFYRKARVASPGWAFVAKTAGIETEHVSLRQEFLAWGTCVIWLYATLVSIGKLLFHQWLVGGLTAAIALVSGVLLYRRITRHGLL